MAATKSPGRVLGHALGVPEEQPARTHDRMAILAHFARRTRRRLAKRRPWFALLRWARR